MVRYFRHCDFLLCKRNCISYARLENFGRGSLGSVTVSCKIGRCLKKVENHWFRVYVLGVRVSFGLGLAYSVLVQGLGFGFRF